MQIILDEADIAAAPESVKDFIRERMRSPRTSPQVPEAQPAVQIRGENLAGFSEEQAKEFLDGCSEKSIRVIAEIVRKNGEALESEIAASVGQEISGVWGGLTKRTQTVLADKSARLIAWENIYDENGQYVDGRSSLAKATLDSFRKALAARRLAPTT